MFKKLSTIYNYFPNLEDLFPWIIKERRQAEELALQAEMIVYELSGLSRVNSNDRDVVTILNSICLLLERFQQHPELLNPKETPIIQPIEVIKTEEIEPQIESPPVPQIVREIAEEKPSVTAQELIRLRDWVLLAKSGEGDNQASPKVLDAIYKQLGKILVKEEITSLEETGSFNYERQQVVSTQVTDDPEKEDLICDIVRPGYLFKGILFRPQEVIVYTYNSSIATSEVS
ncbi:MAG: nucleotide exchange factor GrpE [Microcystis aeruginosa]